MAERRPHEEAARVVTDPLVVRALALFDEDPGKRWTVEELGRELGVSRPVLGRRFVAALGVPPLRTLTRTRLGRAAELLQTTDAGLAWVADAVGYDSEFSFSRAFRRQFGLPPGHYRAQLRRLDQFQATSAFEEQRAATQLGAVTQFDAVSELDTVTQFDAVSELGATTNSERVVGIATGSFVSSGRTVALAA